MDEFIHLQKKKSLWLPFSSLLEIASALFNCLLSQDKGNNNSDFECAADLEDAEMLLHEYFRYTVYPPGHHDQ